MTGALTFKDGNNTVMTIDPAASNVLEIDGNTWMRGDLTVSDVLTIDGSVVEFDDASRMYMTGETIPQDPRTDYGFVQGYNKRTNLSQFLLPSGGTANSGKIAMVNSSGEWALSNGNWVDESGDTMTGTLTIASKSSSKQNALEVNGNVSVSGDVTATGAMYSSDKRLKENIKFIPGDDLENAKKIDFKEFNFIADKSSQKVGVIAQELKENGLGKFTKQNDAGYLTVDYISLLCLKIAQLEKEIKELKEGK